MAQRKCEHFLNSFVEWLLPRSEAPASYILWSGIFVVSSALRRKIWIPKTELGNWECFPHIYIMLVGPPGMRKTSTLVQGLELTEGVQGMNKGPTATSVAALAEMMHETGESSCYLLSEEFSDLLAKSGKDMYEFLTSMYDARKSFDTRTISRKIEFLDKPCVNLAAGTTPIWISKNFPEEVIGGGYAARVIFLYEDELRKKQMYYKHVDFKKIEQIENDLKHDIAHIAKNLNGEVRIEKSTSDWMENWYQTQPSPKSRHPKLQGYYSRKHVHVHKLAMIHKACYSDDLLLEQVDFDFAVGLLEDVEKRLLKVFTGVGKNIYTFDVKEIYAYVQSKGKISREELLEEFISVAEPEKLQQLLDYLILVNKIKLEKEGKTMFYKVA